jgi:hypothetical protein
VVVRLTSGEVVYAASLFIVNPHQVGGELSTTTAVIVNDLDTVVEKFDEVSLAYADTTHDHALEQ